MNIANSFIEEQIQKRMVLDNPWWESGKVDDDFTQFPRRAYLDDFYELVTDLSVKRAVILMGPRRVGKTVMIYHSIDRLISSGIDPKKIIYISVDTPIYNNISLEDFFLLARKALKNEESYEGYYVFFDEIQYLKNWEVHLKSMVDTFRSSRFVASGSAAAALKMKSIESGAGRFSDFLLPPLTFYEYIQFKKLDSLVVKSNNGISPYDTINIDALNRHFVEYINFGGYPEVVFSEAIRRNPGQYIKNDIIDKVLLRDLPSLYGISDIQELNKLFPEWDKLFESNGDEIKKDTSQIKEYLIECNNFSERYENYEHKSIFNSIFIDAMKKQISDSNSVKAEGLIQMNEEFEEALHKLEVLFATKYDDDKLLYTVLKEYTKQKK